jgi:hypothetical protein
MEAMPSLYTLVATLSGSFCGVPNFSGTTISGTSVGSVSECPVVEVSDLGLQEKNTEAIASVERTLYREVDFDEEEVCFSMRDYDEQ